MRYGRMMQKHASRFKNEPPQPRNQIQSDTAQTSGAKEMAAKKDREPKLPQ